MLEVAARELRVLAAVDVDDEDVLAPVAGPADAVELVEDAREAPRLALAVVLLLVGVVAHARREGDARRVRRPHDRLDALLQVGELARLAAVRRDARRSRPVSSSSPRFEANASHLPSGDQRGVASRFSPAVNRLRLGRAVERGDPDRRRGSRSPPGRAAVTVYATRDPSGEIRGSPTLTSS